MHEELVKRLNMRLEAVGDALDAALPGWEGDYPDAIMQLAEERDEARAQAADGLSLIHENRLALNSTDLDDALRQVIQIAITEADNAKIAGRLLNEAIARVVDAALPEPGAKA